MKLVIDIPEAEYNKTLRGNFNVTLANKAVKNGKPLDDVLDEIKAEIEPKCDRINNLASVLPYTAHREIQELLCEIMALCKAESEEAE